MLDISPQCRDDMIGHARSEAPRESCGLILGDDYVPCRNVADDPIRSFQIDGLAMVIALQSGRLRAVIHSHPDGPACPTRTDMTYQAEGEVPWGIVAVSPVHGAEIFFFGDSLPIAPYEGRVFRHGVADCYALVRDWYRQEKAVTLPLTPRDPAWWDLGQNVIEDNLGRFAFDAIGPEEELRVGDVPLFQIAAQAINHTGVYVGHGLVLHHLSNRLSRLDVLGPWRQKFVRKVMRPRACVSTPDGA
ncbi:MAG: C40 family peptidase [Reyranellaceae bacterium]